MHLPRGLAAAALAGALAAGVLTSTAAPAQARGDGYRFIGGGSSPAFWWDRCTTVTVGLDTRFAARTGMRPEWERVRWESVLDEVGFYTGYDFRLVEVRTAPSGGGPRAVGDDRGADVLITYGAKRGPSDFRYPRLRSAGVQAFGGPAWRGREVLRGAIVVNAPAVYDGLTDTRLAPKWAGVDPVRSVYMHELGHVLGLDHVADRRQLMFPYLDLSRDDELGSGDRKALRLLASRPCHSGGARGPVPRGTYQPDETVMPVGDASADPPESCAPTGPCIPEPSPDPFPIPTPPPAPIDGGPAPAGFARTGG